MPHALSFPKILIRPLLRLFVCLFFIQYCYGVEGVDILSFSPQNFIKDVRQVKVSFSDDMVAFGDPRSIKDPFQTSCTPAIPSGHSRWADSKNWTYDFDQDLEGGIQCVFTVKQNLKSLSGKLYIGKNSFDFNTGGPAVIGSQPYEGSEDIDEEQIFILSLNAKVNPQTLLQNVYFAEEGVGEKIPIKILNADPRPEADREKDVKNVVILQAQRRFIPNAKVTLVWGAGVSTLSGIATTTNATYSFKVRSEFSTEFNCVRENANAACSPINSMNLNFSADVPWAQVKQIKLKAQNGKEWYPYSSQKLADDEFVRSVFFKPLFPEKTKFQIVLPSNLRDDAGRPLVNASRFPLETSTTEYTPLIKFPATFGVLELNPEAILPVTVRNVEPNLSGNQFQIAGKQGFFDELKGKLIGIHKGDKLLNIIDWLTRVENADREKSLFSTEDSFASRDLSIKKPNGDKAFEVVGIPIKNAGFYVVEFESKRLGAALLAKSASMYVSTSALITNLSVHFKKGRESSLVWVTSLDQGKPVENASVAIRNCEGAVLASG
ncbi:MAG: alpha-2-macroglobulin, partial [Bdellovibrionota bacterium]